MRERFNSSGEPASGRIGRRLNELMILRAEADYQLVPPLRYKGKSYSIEQLMGQAISVGRALLSALEAYSPGEAPDGCDCPTAYSVG